MDNETQKPALWRELFPSRSVAMLLGIGLVDLIVTAVLHANGMIRELNPFMRYFIEQSEWLFALVKGMTLITAWLALVSYARVNLPFVRRAAFAGSCVYLLIWTVWFLSASVG